MTPRNATAHSRRREEVRRCVANPIEPYYRDIYGIQYCCRCNWSKGLHESMRLAAARKAGAA